MTKNSFELISVGSHIFLVEEQYGTPYDVEECENGIKKYRYIERIATSSNSTDYNYYIFLVGPHGCILEKRLETAGADLELRSQ